MRLGVFCLVISVMGGTAMAGDPIDLRVLYTGDPNTARAADFDRFLNENFTNVTVLDLRSFEEEKARKYDVVIFDWTTQYDRSKETLRRIPLGGTPLLSRDFDKASILIGGVGAKIAERRKLKIDWL